MLEHGRIVWEGTCSMCHPGGIASAPKIGDRNAWQARIKQGLAVLVRHSQLGFSGATGTMPPRGGNALGDNDVAAAVFYMVSKSQ